MAWLNMDFNSEALNMPVVLDVLIPQGRGGYKTLYLLHGAGGDHSSWLLKSRIADYAERNNIAVVMPSGNNKCYANNLHGKNYENFIACELVEKCETFFSISKKKEDRYIAGMSMGGFGAINLALKYPDKYCMVASFSGLLNMIERYDSPQGLDVSLIFGDKDKFTGSDNDLFTEVEKKRNIFNKNNKTNVYKPTEFIITCGKEDPRIKMSYNLYKKMEELDYHVSYSETPGEHDWDYWDQCIKKLTDYIGGKKNGSN